jgi:hypothetical protein
VLAWRRQAASTRALTEQALVFSPQTSRPTSLAALRRDAQGHAAGAATDAFITATTRFLLAADAAQVKVAPEKCASALPTPALP